MRFSFWIFTYPSFFMIPSILMRFPITDQLEHPHSIILPPLCFTMGGVNAHLYGIRALVSCHLTKGPISSIHPSIHSLPEYPEGIHANTGRTCRLHTERPEPDGGIELRTFLLYSSNANHRAAQCRIFFCVVFSILQSDFKVSLNRNRVFLDLQTHSLFIMFRILEIFLFKTTVPVLNKPFTSLFGFLPPPGSFCTVWLSILLTPVLDTWKLCDTFEYPSPALWASSVLFLKSKLISFVFDMILSHWQLKLSLKFVNGKITLILTLQNVIMAVVYALLNKMVSF